MALIPKLLVAVCALMPAIAGAQAYPSKQLRIVVAFPPGGPIDIVARMITAKLSEAMGQSVIVDNRGGAGGTIGVDNVAKSAPDGYSMVLSSTSLGIYPHVQSNRLRAIAITAARRASLLPDLLHGKLPRLGIVTPLWYSRL